MGLKPHLKETFLLRQPPDYDTAVSYAKLTNSTSTSNYGRLLEQTKQLTLLHINTRHESDVTNLNYP